MSLQLLHNAGRRPTLPLTLELAGEPLLIEQWLRTLPGQRYVGVGQWRGRQVLAKLLVGKKALRHFARESQGAAWLLASAQPTAALLAQGEDPAGAWLLFDFLPGQSLGERWAEVAHEPILSTGQAHILARALQAIALLHRQGLWQDDLHLDNLLDCQGQLYWIDGGAVRAQTLGQPLSREQVLANLGVFFAQLPVALEPFFEELLIHYLLANGEHALPLEALLKEVAQARRWRLKDYLKKVKRDCSLFSAKDNASTLQICARHDQYWLAPLLAAPDRYLAQGTLCKDGGTATVAQLELSGRALIIKRYNIKNLSHWLSRCWRPSRAFHSWVQAHRLSQLGIATAEPLAVLEQRFFGLRAKAWLVTEALAGHCALQHWPDANQMPEASQVEALVQLFNRLIKARISHGDLKGSNIFWVQDRWVLIDLDALKAHRSEAGFVRAYAKDRARFLRNWPSTSVLYQYLDQQLPTLAKD